MSDQFTTIGVNRQRRLTKIVKKPSKKELLTLERVRKMNYTKLCGNTLQRNASRFYFTSKIGSRLVLSHPYTDVHGRHIKSVLLDFSLHKNTGYVHVQPFAHVSEDSHGVTTTNYTLSLWVDSHKALYRKLLEHKLL
ncbi:hypothetical protein [Flagellimonas sp. 2504JD4-2]